MSMLPETIFDTQPVMSGDEFFDLPVGLLCIGTRQAGRFHPGLGTELLSFLARVLGIAIAQWLTPRG